MRLNDFSPRRRRDAGLDYRQTLMKFFCEQQATTGKDFSELLSLWRSF
jgi:hypothetical protein